MPAIAVKRLSLYAAIGQTIVVACYAGWLFWNGLLPRDDVFGLHQTILTILLATWFVMDTPLQGRRSPTFDHGWLVMVVLPIYGPYYLVRTRRWQGILMIAGGALLFLLPSLAEVVIWLVVQS
jgi:hypothetical protein